jgi:hypothetical protein
MSKRKRSRKCDVRDFLVTGVYDGRVIRSGPEAVRMVTAAMTGNPYAMDCATAIKAAITTYEERGSEIKCLSCNRPLAETPLAWVAIISPENPVLFSGSLCWPCSQKSDVVIWAAAVANIQRTVPGARSVPVASVSPVGGRA